MRPVIKFQGTFIYVLNLIMKVLTEIKLRVQSVDDCNIFSFSKHYAFLPCHVSVGRPNNEGHRLMSFHLVISLVVKKKTYASTVVVTKSEPLTD